jgi:hypothetical protein
MRSARSGCARAAVGWSMLLGELLAVGFRPYLERQQGQGDDPLRLFCELDDGLLVDAARP